VQRTEVAPLRIEVEIQKAKTRADSTPDRHGSTVHKHTYDISAIGRNVFPFAYKAEGAKAHHARKFRIVTDGVSSPAAAQKKDF
jgi:hypothetical protein